MFRLRRVEATCSMRLWFWLGLQGWSFDPQILFCGDEGQAVGWFWRKEGPASSRRPARRLWGPWRCSFVHWAMSPPFQKPGEPSRSPASLRHTASPFLWGPQWQFGDLVSPRNVNRGNSALVCQNDYAHLNSGERFFDNLKPWSTLVFPSMSLKPVGAKWWRRTKPAEIYPEAN